MATITNAIDSDPDTEVKKKAVFALSQLPRDEGLPKLIEAGGLDQHSRVRAGQSGDGKHADGCGSYEKIGIV